MKHLAAALLISVLVSPALAQEKTITFTLSVSEAQAAINAVGEHPWRDVNPLMQKMIGQVNAQLAPPPMPPSAPSAAQPAPATAPPAVTPSPEN